jgi:hypothetical protein
MWTGYVFMGDFVYRSDLSQFLYRELGPYPIYAERNINWKIVGTGDFDGDGRADILYRNDTTGQVYILLMDGPTIANRGFVYTEPNLDWKIVAVGDYDGDGKADILYRNDKTGQVYMLLMDGLRIANQGFVYSEPNLDWHILGPYEYSHQCNLAAISC